jgi:GTP cyclohydrolase III
MPTVIIVKNMKQKCPITGKMVQFIKSDKPVEVTDKMRDCLINSGIAGKKQKKDKSDKKEVKPDKADSSGEKKTGFFQ